jgi:ligand-binding sensor domain-containing protein
MMLTRMANDPRDARARFRCRLPEARVRENRNRAVAACAMALALAFPSAGLARSSGVWHVGPVPEVRAICHAGDSLVVGTSAGLFVVDLKRGTIARQIVAGPELPSSSVRALATHGDTLFVGTDAGLALTGPDGTHVFTPDRPGPLAGVPLTMIRDIAFARNGDWLVSTGEGGVGVVAPDTVRAITTRDSLLSDNVFAVRERRDGARWFATSAGLCAWSDDTTFVSFQAGAGLPRGEVRQIAVGERDAYLLVRGRGVFRFDGWRATPVDAPEVTPLCDAIAISAGPDGALWAVGGRWIAVRRAGTWSRVALGTDDANESWRTIAADGAGAFAGSAGGVVVALGRGAAWRVRLPGTLPAPRVASLTPDGRGGAWFLCGGRPVRADASSQQAVVEKAPLAEEAITISPTGAVVAAGRWTVRRLDGGAWSDLHPDVIEPDPAYTTAHVDDHGRLWVGTRAGSLYRYDGDIWLRIEHSGGDDARAVLGVLMGNGDVWGRVANNVARAGRDGWQWPVGVDSTTVITDVAVSPSGVWVAATRTGLLQLDRDLLRWTPTTPARLVGAASEDGFALAGPVWALAFDGTGRLFLGTEHGVEWTGPDGLHRLGPAEGIAGLRVADLATDNRYLWIGFALDGLSVVPLDRLP